MATKTEPRPSATVMVSVDGVAEMLGCSTRHVHRLRDAGLMPPAVKIGALVRWSRSVIEEWIAEGCPAIRTS